MRPAVGTVRFEPLLALLLVVAGCETPNEEEPSSTETSVRAEPEASKERPTGSSGRTLDPLDFESAAAAADGSREAFLHAVPSDPRAILWIFHGRGDSREWCRRDHMQPALRAFYEAGFAVVCPQTLDRRAKAWDGGTLERAGPDVDNIRRVRETLRDRQKLERGLPEFGWGVSNGGGFLGPWAHHAEESGIDVRGLQCMIARCERAATVGEEVGLHVHWAAAERDPFFSFDSVRRRYRSADGPKSIVVAEPGELTVERLRERARLSTREAERMRRAMNDHDLLDEGVPSCDPKASGACRRRLGEATRAADLGGAQRAVRYAYEVCRATHTEFHSTCRGTENTERVLEAFRAELD